MLKQGFRTAAALLSTDPFRRIEALERLTEWLLRRNPVAEIERHLEIPPPLPQSSMLGARLFATREEMLRVIPQGGEVVEVGTFKGDFSREISRVVQPGMFHLVDIDFSPFDPTGVVNSVQHKGDSSIILRELPPLDWAYIDGDHSYECARKDAEAAHVVLKPGALMTFNDYTNWASYAVTPYGVARAVNEFVVRHGYTVEGLALDRSGNHDLLVRKPL